MDVWVSLVVGNTSLHWAVMEDGIVLQCWDTPHLHQELPDAKSMMLGTGGLPLRLEDVPVTVVTMLQQRSDPSGIVPMYFASVVPRQTSLLNQLCPHAQQVLSRDVISGLDDYPTFGVDRALALRGAGEKYVLGM